MGLPRAYHHRELCKGAAEHFEQQYCEEVPRELSSRFFSTVTGKELSAAELTKDYWKRHTLEPVRFREATVEVLKALRGDSDRTNCFCGAEKHRNQRHILQAAQDLGMNQVHYQSLTRKEDEVENFCEAVAKLWEWGLSVECGEVFPARKFTSRHDLKHEPRTHFCRQPAFQPLPTAPGIASPASSQKSLANSKSESTDSTATVLEQRTESSHFEAAFVQWKGTCSCSIDSCCSGGCWVFGPAAQIHDVLLCTWGVCSSYLASFGWTHHCEEPRPAESLL